MANVYENLEIVDVLDEEDKITFVLLDPDRQEIHDVKWRKRVFDSDKQEYVDDEDKLNQVKEWCKVYFDLDLADISQAVGRRATVYGYDTFDSFWESDAKFEKKDTGKMIQTTVKDIEVTNEYIKIRYDWKGKTYASYKRFTQKRDDVYYVNPVKRNNQYKWFEKTFGVPVEERDSVVGKNIIVEVKSVFGQSFYGDIKPSME